MRFIVRRVVSTIATPIACMPFIGVQAETVLSTSELLATTPAQQAALPPVKAFNVTTAGTYQVELEDAAFPAPITDLHAIVVHDGQSVAKVDIGARETGTDTFDAVPGEYRIHVLGQPGAGQPAGTYSVRVRAVGSQTGLLTAGGFIQREVTPDAATSVALIPLDIKSQGNYTVTVTDHHFPASLPALPQVLVMLENGNVVVDPASGSVSFTADPSAKYTVAAIAAVNPGGAGLYGLKVEGAGLVVHESTQQAGTFPLPLTIPAQPAATYDLSARDAAFPLTLNNFRLLIVQGSRAIHLQDGPTTGVPVQLGSGEIKIYASIDPANNAGVGTVGVKLKEGGNPNPVYANVLISDIDPSPTTPGIYSVTSKSAMAEGAYRLHVRDFSFPTTLSTLRSAIVQDDAVLSPWSGDGQFTFTAAAGTARVLIAATPSSTTGTGLFGLRLEPDAGGAAILESNQGVGGLFRSHVVTLASGGSRDIRLTDLEFPALLQTSALAVTSGTELIGQVFGGGQLRTSLSAETYVLNFLGKPDPAERYGAYALEIEDSPAAPTLTFSANPASVTSGGTTTLQWTATDATACTASGAWSGTKNLTGSLVTAALNADTTFQMACDGPGGSVQKSVTVQVSAASKKSGGGGLLGAVDGLLLALTLLYTRRWRWSSQRA